MRETGASRRTLHLRSATRSRWSMRPRTSRPQRSVLVTTNAPPVKLCKDCEHYDSGPSNTWIGTYRSPPPDGPYLHCYGDPVRSLIDGSIRVSDAHTQRSTDADDHCGRVGRWFKPKAPPPPPLRILREGETPWACCGGGAENHVDGPCAAQRQGRACRYGRLRMTSNGPPRCAGGATADKCLCHPTSWRSRLAAWWRRV